MRSSSIAVLMLLSVAAVPAHAADLQWVKTGGPSGGLGYNVRVHPTDKNIMLVTDAWAGVHRTTDGGRTWQAVNTGIATRSGPSGDGIPVFSLSIDQRNPNIVWAGTQGIRGVFKSTDGGLTYARMESGITENVGLTVRNFEIHPSSSDIVFLTGEVSTGVQGREFERVQGVMYRTTNGGLSWTKIWQGDSLARWAAIDPADPQNITIFTGIFDREAVNTTGLGVVRTANGGASWSPANQGITGSLFIGGMAVKPGAPTTIVAGTGNITDGHNGIHGGLFRTTDGGSTWTQVLPPQAPNSPGDNDNLFTAAAFAPSSSAIAYATSGGSFFRSADGGLTWTRRSPADQRYGAPGVPAGFPIEITVDRDDPNTLFVNNYGGGVFKSTDGAQTWENLSKGYTGALLKTVAVSHQDRVKVFASGRSGPFTSANGGGDWSGMAFGPLAQGTWEFQGLAVHPRNAANLLASDHGQGVIWGSSDGGRSWTERFRHPQADGSNPQTSHGAKDIAFAPSDPQIVYAGYAAANFYTAPEASAFPVSLGVMKSTDGGLTWTAKNSGLEATNLNITALAVGATDATLVYAGTRGSGLFKSTNGGDSWVNTTGNLPSQTIHGLALSPTTPGLVYAATKEAGVWKSTNGGATWTQSLSGDLASSIYPSKMMMAVVIDPRNDAIVYAADYRSGVYRTTDGGATWTPITAGLATRAVSSLALSADGVYLYAGTWGEGVFRLQTDAPVVQWTINGGLAGTAVTVSNPVTFSYTIQGGQGQELFLAVDAPALGLPFSYKNAAGQWVRLPANLATVTPFATAPADGDQALFSGPLPAGRYTACIGYDTTRNGTLDLAGAVSSCVAVTVR